MNDIKTYKINGWRIAARTDAQARFAVEAIQRQARETRSHVRDAKRIGLARSIPGFKQSL